jgi:tripartite-type tricarboxylate transporter receptor subunit TctC
MRSSARFVLESIGRSARPELSNKPVRIVTAEVGGGSAWLRLIAQILQELLGKQVIVDNRGILAIEVIQSTALMVTR